MRVARPSDVERARRAARALAREVGLTQPDAEAVALAVSELGSNLLRYGWGGFLVLRAVERPRSAGVEVVSQDSGPGIRDSALAMQDGYSTSGGLGGGLPGVRRLMDDFQLESSAAGTRIVCRKWRRAG